jgi:hypothetical protein
MKSLTLLTPEQQRERLETLKGAIRDGAQIFVEVGNALNEIKANKYYLLDGHKTFEEFYEKEYGWGRRHVNEVIQASRTVLALPPEAASKVTTIKAAKALSKLPPPKAAQTIAKVVESGQPVTEANVRKASPPPPRKPAQAPEPREKDSTGFFIPKSLLELWERRTEVQALLSAISEIRSTFKEAERTEDPLFSRVSFNSVHGHLDQLYADIISAKPHAVCPTCGGNPELIKTCALCKGLGFLSEFYWRPVSAELKRMRQAVVDKQK